MPWRAALIAALVLAGAASADDPVMLPEAAHGDWQAIGRLNRAGYRTRSMCSATLIAPAIVLTAAHCVTGPDGAPLPAEAIRFVAGWLKGAHAGLGQAASIRVAQGWPDGIAAGAARIGADLAVIGLAAPLPGVAPLPSARLVPGTDVRVLGYRADRPHALSDSGTCPASAAGGGAHRMTCAVTFGTSGAPVLQRHGHRWAVIGVVSGMGGGLSYFAAAPPEAIAAAIAWQAD